MTTIEKIKEILCTVPEVEKDLMELKRGCVIETQNFPGEYFEYLYELEKDEDGYTFIQLFKLDKKGDNYFHIWKEEIGYHNIIGNPLQERHLRMYCESKNIYIKINANGMICEWKNLEPFNNITTLDNTKDFENQSEETLGGILAFLESIQ